MKINPRKQKIQLGNGAITNITHHPVLSNTSIVTVIDGNIHFLKLNPFKIERTVKVFHQFCLCSLPFRNGICAGSSSGELVFMELSGNIIQRQKIHNDCLSGITESEKYLVTVGHDGLVKFLNKENFKTEIQVNLQSPIWSVISFDKKIYTAGNPSFAISEETFQPVKLKRFDGFAKFQNKLYACSDQRGFTCLSSNSNSYIPCNFILPLKQRMMIFSEECIGEITHKDQMSWKCHKIREIKKGTTITSGFVHENSMILGDVEGAIYKIDMEDEIERQE